MATFSVLVIGVVLGIAVRGAAGAEAPAVLVDRAREIA
jgi:hypothetical protein